MIKSWKEFFVAVEQMRECQKEYFRRKTSASLMAAKMCEKQVDTCIKEKRAEWTRQLQPELA